MPLIWNVVPSTPACASDASADALPVNPVMSRSRMTLGSTVAPVWMIAVNPGSSCTVSIVHNQERCVHCTWYAVDISWLSMEIRAVLESAGAPVVVAHAEAARATTITTCLAGRCFRCPVYRTVVVFPVRGVFNRGAGISSIRRCGHRTPRVIAYPAAMKPLASGTIER